MLVNEYIQKKPSIGKFAEDTERAWEHSLMHADTIPG